MLEINIDCWSQQYRSTQNAEQAAKRSAQEIFHYLHNLETTFILCFGMAAQRCDFNTHFWSSMRSLIQQSPKRGQKDIKEHPQRAEPKANPILSYELTFRTEEHV